MKNGCAILFVIGVLILILGKCAQPADTYDVDLERAKARLEMAADDGNSPRLPPSSEGSPFSVESDPQASYRLLTWSRMRNGHIEALTRRDGPSGTSFARRELDCVGQTFRYLGEGDTREDALKDSPNIGEMADLVSGSIADVTLQFACRKARK